MPRKPRKPPPRVQARTTSPSASPPSAPPPPSLKQAATAAGFKSITEVALRVLGRLDHTGSWRVDQRRAVWRVTTALRQGGPSAEAAERIFAELVELEPSTLWPERYAEDGTRVVVRFKGPTPDQALSRWLRSEHGITFAQLAQEPALEEFDVHNVYGAMDEDKRTETLIAIAEHLGEEHDVLFSLYNSGAPRKNREGKLERALHSQAVIEVTCAVTGEIFRLPWTKHPWHTLEQEGWEYDGRDRLISPEGQ